MKTVTETHQARIGRLPHVPYCNPAGPARTADAPQSQTKKTEAKTSKSTEKTNSVDSDPPGKVSSRIRLVAETNPRPVFEPGALPNTSVCVKLVYFCNPGSVLSSGPSRASPPTSKSMCLERAVRPGARPRGMTHMLHVLFHLPSPENAAPVFLLTCSVGANKVPKQTN